MPANQERLGILTLPDQSCQVAPTPPGTNAQTARARSIEVSVCVRCREFIGRRPFHEVNDLFYHASCVKPL